MFLLVPKEKIIRGLMHRLAIFLLRKNGLCAKEKIGNRTGKIKKQTGHLLGRQYRFHCVIFPAMLKAEGSYILPDNVPANEF
jgi:methionyl-tRNA synthetase